MLLDNITLNILFPIRGCVCRLCQSRDKYFCSARIREIVASNARVFELMRSRWKFRNVLAVIAAVGSLLLVGGVVLTREPKYEGRTAREWIYLLDPHVDHRAQHDMAAEAVVKIGGAAVPTIRDILREPRVTVLQKIKVLAHQHRCRGEFHHRPGKL